jgi:lysozyme
MTRNPPPSAGASPRPSSKASLGLAGCIGAACAALLTATVTQWESGGKDRLVAYPDIVGVWTICHGETQGVRKGMTDSKEGCALRLDTRLAKDFAPAVLACTPRLRGRSYQLAAAISLAYNIGTPSYCRSTVDRRFDAGAERAACDAFLMWNKAGGKPVNGLTRRREAERRLCLTGAL